VTGRRAVRQTRPPEGGTGALLFPSEEERSTWDGAPRAESLPAQQAARAPQARDLPRKEVIQPQLPLRLPCYDFVPITNPTLDTSVPRGFGQWLQVLPAFMT
jgi:hypothetical protein